MEVVKSIIFCIVFFLFLVYLINFIFGAKVKLDMIIIQLTNEDKIEIKKVSEKSSISPLLYIKSEKDFFKKMSNFTKEDLEKLGINFKKIKKSDIVIFEEIYKENEFLNFLNSNSFKEILEKYDISDDEFNKFKREKFNSGKLEERLEKLNKFIEEKRKIKFAKINEVFIKKYD